MKNGPSGPFFFGGWREHHLDYSVGSRSSSQSGWITPSLR